LFARGGERWTGLDEECQETDDQKGTGKKEGVRTSSGKTGTFTQKRSRLMAVFSLISLTIPNCLCQASANEKSTSESKRSADAP
jgi:hypothetical protein